MMNYGIGEALIILLWCILPIAWIGLSIFTLLALKSVHLNETARALWALLIVLVPILGAVAYWLVRPTKEAVGSNSRRVRSTHPRNHHLRSPASRTTA
jgi:hypothetical protein